MPKTQAPTSRLDKFALALHVIGLDGFLIATLQPPPEGWTHNRLQDQAQRLRDDTRDGADAWLGSRWIGSTEV